MKKILKSDWLLRSEKESMIRLITGILTMLKRAKTWDDLSEKFFAIIIEIWVICELSAAPVQKPERKQRKPNALTSLQNMSDP